MTRVVKREASSLKRRVKVAIARFAIGVFAGVASFANAADNVAAPRDAIDATKREFDALKAARDPAQQQKGTLPKIGVPELQTATPEPRPWPATKNQKLEPTAKKSTNWLVEAMEKDARQRASADTTGDRDGARRAGRDGANDDELGLSFGETGGAKTTLARDGEKSGSNKARENRESSEKNAAPNPLAQYLGEWLTPRDYAVLRPGLEESASRGVLSDQVRGIGGSADASALVSGSAGIGAALGMITPAPFSPEPARENPYLQTIETSVSAPAGASGFAPILPPLTAPPAPLATASAVAPLPPPSAPARPKIPEFAKPAQDEKYFKQLKRF